MKKETIQIGTFSTVVHNWFFYMVFILLIYWIILMAGNPLAYSRVTQAAEETLKINIILPEAWPESEIKAEPLRLNIKKSRKFQPIINQVADRYEVDPDLVRAVIMVESSYNPLALSNKGAMGLMQLMPRTARAMGVQDCFNPEHNINGGVRYLKKLLTRYNGDIELALAAYNAGIRKVMEYRGVPPFKATRLY
ncbi:MAG: lytic transglycosylase domain-containing protein, partial [Deltaproteobacteria bacterium]|nr:lytic transglycosylase domain-containing protein [Deltaproteobacteria bacterium]